MDNDLRFLWDAAPIGLAKVARDGKFISVNPRFAEMVGYSASELSYHKTFQQITHPDDLDADVSEAEALASDPEKRHYQMVKRYLSKDSRTVWVSLCVFAVRDSEDRFIHFLVFATELTPVNVSTNNPAHSKLPTTGGAVTLLDYIKRNPKEAILVFTAITLLTQGKSMVEVLQTILQR